MLTETRAVMRMCTTSASTPRRCTPTSTPISSARWPWKRPAGSSTSSNSTRPLSSGATVRRPAAATMAAAISAAQPR